MRSIMPSTRATPEYSASERELIELIAAIPPPCPSASLMVLSEKPTFAPLASIDFTSICLPSASVELHPGKRGMIKADEPKALLRLGLDKNHWTMKVKGVGSSYWRVVGNFEELIEKAKELKQRTLFGIGFARLLKNI